MKLKHFLAASACLVLVGGTTLAQDKPTVGTVLATVNGVDITVGHVIALTARLPEQYQGIPDADLYKGVLDQLINQTAISTKADTDNLATQLAIENETRALLAAQTLEDVATNAVNEELVQAAYDEQYGNLPPKPEYRASHILVETEDEAKALIESLAGGADFAELAKEKSTGPSGAGGGDLGWFTPERMVPEFSNAVKEMQVDGISSPIKTQFGWHVIKLFGTRDVAPPSLEEVRGGIEEKMGEAAMKAAITKLEAEATITRNDVEIDPAIIRQLELLD